MNKWTPKAKPDILIQFVAADVSPLILKKSEPTHVGCYQREIIANWRRLKENCAVNFRKKIIAWEKLSEWRKQFRASGEKLAVTNGCFDILHLGHVTYLETARNFGDALLVGVNGDEAVCGLKGAGRPINSENDRAAILAALESVAAVCIFPEKTAVKFLGLAQPDIYVKGGDYTLETLNQDERRAVESAGGKIKLIPFVPGKSTTALLEKISRL